MPSKYKKLDASTTGLPWETGAVHTATCHVCEKNSIDLFRRCRKCGYTICSRQKCFNALGFQHPCMSDNGEGPYPTLAEETRILALHGSDTPARDNALPEPPNHTISSWPASGHPTAVGVTGHSATSNTSTLPVTTNRIPSLNPVRVPKPRRNNPVRKNTPKNNTKLARSNNASGKKRARSSSEDSIETGSGVEAPVAHDTQSIRKAPRLNGSNSASQHASVDAAIHGPPFGNNGAFGMSFTPHEESLSNLSEKDVMGRSYTMSQSQQEAVTKGNELIIDVRNIDKLRITVTEGFHATNPGSRAGYVNTPTQIFFEYANSDDGLVHIEPVVRITDNDEPGQGPMLRRAVNPAGYRNTVPMSGYTVASFQNAIMSIKRPTVQSAQASRTVSSIYRGPLDDGGLRKASNDVATQPATQSPLRHPIRGSDIAVNESNAAASPTSQTPRSANFKTPLTPDNFRAARGMLVSPIRIDPDTGKAMASHPKPGRKVIASPTPTNMAPRPGSRRDQNGPKQPTALTEHVSDPAGLLDNGDDEMSI